MKRIELKVGDKKDYLRECLGLYLFYDDGGVHSVCVIYRLKHWEEDSDYKVKNISCSHYPFIDVMDQVVSFLKSN